MKKVFFEIVFSVDNLETYCYKSAYLAPWIVANLNILAAAPKAILNLQFFWISKEACLTKASVPIVINALKWYIISYLVK